MAASFVSRSPPYFLSCAFKVKSKLARRSFFLCFFTASRCSICNLRVRFGGCRELIKDICTSARVFRFRLTCRSVFTYASVASSSPLFVFLEGCLCIETKRPELSASAFYLCSFISTSSNIFGG